MDKLQPGWQHALAQDVEREIERIQKYRQLLHVIAHDCASIPCAHVVPARYDGGPIR